MLMAVELLFDATVPGNDCGGRRQFYAYQHVAEEYEPRVQQPIVRE